MRIAILGWGSLIWDKRDLKVCEKSWNEDGPRLPIEFARISGGGRLTLVIKPNTKQVNVLYSTSEYTDLNDAIENLRIREDTQTHRIGFYNFQTGDKNTREPNTPILNNLITWNESKGFDAVIWTDLPPNFWDKLKLTFDINSIKKVLSMPKYCDFELAKEYVRKTPKQVETQFRGEIESILLEIEKSHHKE